MTLLYTYGLVVGTLYCSALSAKYGSPCIDTLEQPELLLDTVQSNQSNLIVMTVRIIHTLRYYVLILLYTFSVARRFFAKHPC